MTRPYPTTMHVAAATTRTDAIADVLASIDGTAYVDRRPDPSHLPFTALVVGTTDRLSVLEDIANVGLYLVCQRTVKPGSPKVVGLFPMISHPELGHDASDAHWRDNHGPLALEQHRYMTGYFQLNVLQTLSGRPINGFALCGFETEEDLRNRFYSEPGGEQIIAEDVAKFADLKRSPRRLIATVER